MCGYASAIGGTSIESYESTGVSGYPLLAVTLMATYASDPSITLTGVRCSQGSGSVGREPEAASVPEPGTLAHLGGRAGGLPPRAESAGDGVMRQSPAAPGGR